MAGNHNKTKKVCHFDVANNPFKCHFDVVTQYFEELLLDLKERKELIKHIEYI